MKSKGVRRKRAESRGGGSYLTLIFSPFKKQGMKLAQLVCRHIVWVYSEVVV